MPFMNSPVSFARLRCDNRNCFNEYFYRGLLLSCIPYPLWGWLTGGEEPVSYVPLFTEPQQPVFCCREVTVSFYGAKTTFKSLESVDKGCYDVA